MSDAAILVHRFGPFALDARRRRLLRDGRAVALTPKAFDLLLALVQRPGEVLNKDELMQTVWPGQALEEANLTVNMSTLRKALGEPHERKYIATIPGRGYTFIAIVSTSSQRDETADIDRPFGTGQTRRKVDGDVRPPSTLNLFARAAIGAAAGLSMVAAAFVWWPINPVEWPANAPVRSIAVVPFRPFGAAGTENPEAHRLYLLGRFHWSKIVPCANSKSIDLFNEAVRLDPNYALAYAGLADAYVSEAADLPTPSATSVRATSAANRAVELDDKLAEAHVALGRVKAYLEFDWEGAGREFIRAIDLQPNSADARREYGLYLAVIGRHNDALAATRQALEMDPAFLMTNFAVGWALIGARQYDQTIAHFERALEIDPRFAGAPHFIGLAYVGKSMYGDAVTQFRKALRLSPDNVPYKAQLGFALARVGSTHEAETILADLNGSLLQRYVSPYYSALVLAGLDRLDLAFVDLEKAYEARSRRLWALKVVPTWEPLRSDDRFHRLLQRLGLPN